MSRKRKYQKTNGFYVYAHITPDGLFYIGTSKRQPCERWKQGNYKGKSLEPYIQRFGWENIRHFIFTDGLTKEQAYQLEDLLIQEATDKGYCINKNRSGLIEVSDKNAYMRQLYATNEQHREKQKVRIKQYLSSPEGKIYNRVKSFNKNHPDKAIETPMEAKQKYLESGVIPSYIKNDDLC